MTSFQNFACVQHVLFCAKQMLTHQNKLENRTLYKLTFGLWRGTNNVGLRNNEEKQRQRFREETKAFNYTDELFPMRGIT